MDIWDISQDIVSYWADMQNLNALSKKLEEIAGYEVGPISVVKDTSTRRTILQSETIPGYVGERDDVHGWKDDHITQIESKVWEDKLHSECICNEFDW